MAKAFFPTRLFLLFLVFTGYMPIQLIIFVILSTIITIIKFIMLPAERFKEKEPAPGVKPQNLLPLRELKAGFKPSTSAFVFLKIGGVALVLTFSGISAPSQGRSFTFFVQHQAPGGKNSK
jgi:hypothetical protein